MKDHDDADVNNSSEDRSRNGAQTPSGHDGNVIADDGKLKAIR